MGYRGGGLDRLNTAPDLGPRIGPGLAHVTGDEVREFRRALDQRIPQLDHRSGSDKGGGRALGWEGSPCRFNSLMDFGGTGERQPPEWFTAGGVPSLQIS